MAGLSAGARALDGIDVFRVGTRHTFSVVRTSLLFAASRRSGRTCSSRTSTRFRCTRRDGARKATVALVPHLFGATAFQEFAAPLAAAVWMAERPLGRAYRGVPFQAISESTADDLAERGIPRASVEVIYPGIDTVAYTPNPA